MYQFFVNEPISVDDKITLSKEQSHHALTVLRLHHETVRVVYEGKAYFGEMTFTSDCGRMPFFSKEFLLQMGEKVDLSLAPLKK